MQNTKQPTLFWVRHILELTQYILGLILLGLEIYEKLQYLHLI